VKTRRADLSAKNSKWRTAAWSGPRAILPVITGTFFAWIVLTKSLPFALTEHAPELALRLNPNSSVTLIALAERKRRALLELTQQSPNTSALSTAPENQRDPAPENAHAHEGNAEIDRLRKEIGSLARLAIANDPLNARAFRLLAELSESRDQMRKLMNEAVKRSRREAAAVYWVMADSHERGDLSDAVDKADILLRTRSQLTSSVMGHLAAIAATPEGRAILVPVLKQRPNWRGSFFTALPRNIQLAGTPFELMVALRDAGEKISVSELAPYLDVLVSEDLASYAYEVWLELLPEEQGQKRLLNNSDFAHELSGLAFDWTIQRGENAFVEFVPAGNGKRGRVVQFGFGVGRLKFPELSQIVLLDPGAYRFNGEIQGSLRAVRGLRWELRCRKGKELAQTGMLYGDPNGAWQSFSFDVQVPDDEGCRTQKLRLFHDARSASEQFVTGQASFRDLTLTQIHSR
jgi:hypothetical protein